MSNLSDLLPAGAGAKSATFTASGTLPSGQTVILNTDGTVSLVAGNSLTVGSVGDFPVTNGGGNDAGICYDPDTQKIIIAYRDNDNSSYGTAVVGTVSGNSITFGTKVAYHSYTCNENTPVYDTNADRVVIAFRDSNQSYRISAVAGAVSGTSISFGSVQTSLSTFNSEGLTGCYATVDNLSVFCWHQNAGSPDNRIIVRSVSCSGTTLTFNTETEVDTGGDAQYTACTYDSTNDRVIFVYRGLYDTNNGLCRVGEVSGAGWNFGSIETFETGAAIRPNVIHDASTGKNLIVWDNTNDQLNLIVGTVSGNSISFGTAVSDNTYNPNEIVGAYDAGAEKILLSFQDDVDSSLKIGEVTISGTTPTLANVTEVYSSAVSDHGNSMVYDANAQKCVTTFCVTNDGKYFVTTVSATNSANFVGITDEAIANAATGSVVVEGGVTEKVSGLTTGSTYYVQNDGTLSTTTSSVTAGKALSATKLLLKG